MMIIIWKIEYFIMFIIILQKMLRENIYQMKKYEYTVYILIHFKTMYVCSS